MAPLRGGKGFVGWNGFALAESYLHVYRDETFLDSSMPTFSLHTFEGQTYEMNFNIVMLADDPLWLALTKIQLRVIELTQGWQKKHNPSEK